MSRRARQKNDLLNSKKSKKDSKKQKDKKKSNFRSVRNFFLGFVFISIIVCFGVGAGMYMAVSAEMEEMNVKSLALNYSSFMYYNDKDGNSHEIQQLYSDDNRIWVDEIPKMMKDAIVSIEDERFYSHYGVDVKRTTGAVIKWGLSKVGIGSPSYGGSTITQQVIKNITKEDEKTATRKIKEMMRAVALERELTKDQILTMYANIVYFSQKCHGVEAASNVYFNKSVDELTLAETASIAGITQTPARYDPFVHPDNNVEKRNRVLTKMFELGKITEDEYEKAIESELVTSTEHKNNRSNVSSYFVDQVINDVIQALQIEKGYSATFAEQQVFSGGLKIFTTMDKDIQDTMEKVFTNTASFPKTSPEAQAAMMIIDPHNGEIKGMVGGVGKKTERRGLNRAVHIKRQPGSSFKPLAVYSPAIEGEKITAASVIKDEKITIAKWEPKNSYTGFKGDMLVGEAVEISANIPAVKVLDMYGVDNSYNFVKEKFRISTLKNEDKNLSSLGLGGLTDGVTVKEMAAAYGVFATGGKYVKPYTFTKVVDNSGKVLLENKPEQADAIEPETAFIMSKFLYEVVNGGNGTARNAKLSKIPTYGKTGTTNNDHDKWFIGYTPYYVGAVWYGFDTPKSIKEAGVSYSPSVRVWKSVMEEVHKGLVVKDLEKPENVIKANICSVTGKLASSTCKEVDGYFKAGTQPKKYCSGGHSGSETHIDGDNLENSEIDSTPSPNTTNNPSEAVNTGEARNSPTPTKKPADTSANGESEATAKPTSAPRATDKPLVRPSANPEEIVVE